MVKQVAVDPYPVERGCGSYNVARVFEVQDSSVLLADLKRMDNKDLTGLLIGGRFHEMSDLNKRFSNNGIRTSIPFRQGYRAFDFELFEAYYVAALENGKKRIRLNNHFYLMKGKEASKPEELDFAIITDINGYLKFDN